ncbi:MAG: hypothetical protein ACSHX0_02495 [Akkermansiaceae bacterium]
MKFFTNIMILTSCSAFCYGGEISGKIQLKQNGELKTERGQVYIGEIDSNPDEHPEELFLGFHPYFRGMVDAVRDQRMVSISETGDFNVKDVPLNKDLVVVIMFSGVTHFIETRISEGDTMVINKTIDLDFLPKNLTVNVKNETGITFEFKFASSAYLIQKGKEGRVFLSREKGGQIKFKGVPEGLYTLNALTQIGDFVPNRVDSVTVEVTEEAEQSLNFKVK